MNAQDHLISDISGLRRVLAYARRIAVLGIKTQAQFDQAAFYVPEYLDSVGLEVIPVPVYYPEVTEILGKPVVRKLSEIAGPVDLVNLFRRPSDLPAHLDELLALRPRAVWMQLGIAHPQVAQALAQAGIDVVQNRCLMVDHRHYGPQAG